MNKTILIGRLTQDIELKKTKTNKSYAEFTIAVSREFKNASGEYETDFIRVQTWNQTADYLSEKSSKGTLIAISGSLRVDVYQDHAGQHYKTYVQADRVEVLQRQNVFHFKEKQEDSSKSGGENTAENLDISPEQFPFY